MSVGNLPAVLPRSRLASIRATSCQSFSQHCTVLVAFWTGCCKLFICSFKFPSTLTLESNVCHYPPRRNWPIKLTWLYKGSVTAATVNDCKQQATCCNFGNQVAAGHQSSVSFAIYSRQCCYWSVSQNSKQFISLLSDNYIAVCGVQAV